MTDKRCETCGGTGWIWCMNSWFRTDGMRRERCGICAGSGRSAFRCEPAYRAFQAQARSDARVR